ncbi:MAG TPA: methyltransferase domain-containing protein [Polyangia bacterium]|jgi:SAM-dependent methyltransferase
MKVTQVLYGLATFIPGVAPIFGRGGGDTKSARYCYSVWMRHLVTAFENDLWKSPQTIAELGPGDSLGVGLAALVSGVETYRAFDVVEHANVTRNLAVLEELVSLYRSRADIPGEAEFPEVRPNLKSYAFPRHILTDALLAEALVDARLARIRHAVQHQNAPGAMVDYRTRWFDEASIERDSIDLVLSQAVLEHVDQLAGAYRAMGLWLKPGGLLSHEVDFRCHNTAHEWNGHWQYSDRTWRVIRGKRSYLLNREPYSRHLQLLAENGFDLVGGSKDQRTSRLTKADLAPRFRQIAADDLTTSTAHLQAVKRPSGSPAPCAG